MTPAFTAAQATAFRLDRQHLHGNAPRGRRAGASLADVCGGCGGIQAQVMAAAEISIWTRRHATARPDVAAALWETRELVRTSAMRLTLHVVPARDFAMYIAALKPMATATLQRWQARVGASQAEVAAMIETVVDSLRGDVPQTQRELIAQAKKKARRGIGAWIDHAWSAVRPAVIDGSIVYGPPRGAEATFVRADAWLGPQAALRVEDARLELLRRFLSAFGPATAHDFAKWSGLKTGDARSLLTALDDEAIEVTVDGAPGWILRRDAPTLASSRLDERAVRLLPAFDSLLLAHATKEHLVEANFYKRVYRPQGWISPTVLLGGRIAGVWFAKPAGRQMVLDVQLFGRVASAVREAIEEEADALSGFLGVPCRVTFGKPL